MTDEEIRIFKDGDQWCALRGPDLQEGGRDSARRLRRRSWT